MNGDAEANASFACPFPSLRGDDPHPPPFALLPSRDVRQQQATYSVLVWRYPMLHQARNWSVASRFSYRVTGPSPFMLSPEIRTRRNFLRASPQQQQKVCARTRRYVRSFTICMYRVTGFSKWSKGALVFVAARVPALLDIFLLFFFYRPSFHLRVAMSPIILREVRSTSCWEIPSWYQPRMCNLSPPASLPQYDVSSGVSGVSSNDFAIRVPDA